MVFSPCLHSQGLAKARPSMWIGDTFAGRDARPVDLRESQGCVTIGTRTAVQAQTVALTIAVLPTHSPLAAFWLLRFVPAM